MNRAESANQSESLWPAEYIPDDAILYYRVHRSFQDDGKPKASAFKNRSPEGKPPSPDDGMSTDWNKYSTAHDTLARSKVQNDNIVIGLRAKKVRQVPMQTVEHTPIHPSPEKPLGNRAHTDIKGEKKNNSEVRLKMLEIYWIALRSADEAEIDEDTYRAMERE